MKLEKILLNHQFNPANLVTSHDIFSKKSIITKIGGTDVEVEQKRFADDSLFSKRIFGDMDSLEEYSCECQKLKGKFYEGTICPHCKKPVEFVGLNINKYGWIDLSLSKYDDDGVLIEEGVNKTQVIEYIPYLQLEKVIGRDNLRNIIHCKNVLTATGEIDTEELERQRGESAESKYYYFGIDDFYKNYNEILSYYYELRGQKYQSLYNYLKNKEEVFTDKIPVVSIILRPAMRTEDGLKLDDINIKYQNILKNLSMLKDSAASIKIIKDSTVEQIQSEFMQLSEEILDAIKSKSGLIRNQICGTRINFSARNIISPAKAGIKIDEIVVPYLTFLELYKFEIMNILKTTEGISFKEAEKEWYEATLKFNKKIHMIMTKMIKESEVGVLLNRNPTISYGSILYLRVVEVKDSYDDVTMSISNNILTSLAGDYDKIIKKIAI